MKTKLINWKGKLRRTINMLFDESETFQDNPLFRYEIILSIWKEN
jgi:hypothetical protein